MKPKQFSQFTGNTGGNHTKLDSLQGKWDNMLCLQSKRRHAGGFGLQLRS